MTRFAGLLAAALVLFAATAVYAGGSMGSSMSMSMSAMPSVYTPSTIKWVKGMGGMTVATLEGDMTKPGPWTIRLMFPAGTKLPPHFHNDTERATVISGTFEVGVGKTFDASKLTALPAGSYVVIPAHVWHYAMSKTDTVIQLTGTSPFAMETSDKSGM